MNKIVILFFSLFLSFSCKKVNLDCKKFKIGKFRQNIEELNLIVQSTRTKEGFQIDSTKFGVSKYQLSWKTNCTLESTLIETSIETSKKHIGRKYYVNTLKILSETEYIYSCKVDGMDFIDQDTIIKIN